MEKTRISGRRRAYIGLMRALMYIAANYAYLFTEQ